MTASLPRTLACSAAALALTLAGCSGSGKNSTASTPPTSAPPTTSSAASTPAGSATLGAAAKQQITQAYATFFNTKTSLQKSMAVLQHGTEFRAALVAESKSPSAQGVTAKVSQITAQSPSVAVVTFSLMSGGSALLPDTHGYAVLEDGHWKVAAQTFCALLTIQGGAPAVCKDASVTSLTG